ncbi:MAG: AAA family ATPase [Microthrixaceae bacterium]
MSDTAPHGNDAGTVRGQVAEANLAQDLAGRLHEAVSTVLRGKPEALSLVLGALLSGGHVLIEDRPGTGKTLLARAVAAALGGQFGRVQCTPDLLPSDITGTSVYRPDSSEWEFHPGPVFANVVLVDEINRASPRTQSALLQPMEEGNVTVDRETRLLPTPFMCIATQNPYGQYGTFPLPESQLDRFTLAIGLGLPGRDAEREVLGGVGGADSLDTLAAVATPAEVVGAIAQTRDLYCAPALVDYLLDLAEATRGDGRLGYGASPRACLGVLGVARGHAVMQGRDHVTPDDIQTVWVPSLAHRVGIDGRVDTAAAREVLGSLLEQVPVPRR